MTLWACIVEEFVALRARVRHGEPVLLAATIRGAWNHWRYERSKAKAAQLRDKYRIPDDCRQCRYYKYAAGCEWCQYPVNPALWAHGGAPPPNDCPLRKKA